MAGKSGEGAGQEGKGAGARFVEGLMLAPEEGLELCPQCLSLGLPQLLRLIPQGRCDPCSGTACIASRGPAGSGALCPQL